MQHLPDPHAGQADGAGSLDVIVVGGGQAGLATAYHLKQRGLRFLVLDADHGIGDSWRKRWDSLRLFTPARHDALPGMPFPAAEDDTYPSKDDVADYLAAYAVRFDLPVLLGCRVLRLDTADEGYAVHTTHGLFTARQVVVATGPFQTPVVPAIAADLPADVQQMHSAEYRRPQDLPPGQVVVVGGGNSGRQIALELAATHDVTLAVGSEPLELPQRLLGRDLFWWLTRLGVITRPADSRLARRMRARGDLVIGSTARALRGAGVTLRGRVVAAGPEGLRFEAGGAEDGPARPGAVVWATGYRADHGWIAVPGVVDGGAVIHRRGVTPAPGLYFVGLPWQHTRGSALLGFVKHDAEFIAQHLSAPNGSRPGTGSEMVGARVRP